MKKVKVKVPAKVNLTLDVLGLDGGYHSLKSFVASVDVFDTITVKARRDGKITLENRGLDVGCDITDNNAYKGAKSFIDTFGTCGVDIVIDKKIPVGGGLGGSSADIAGVLNAMKELYGVKDDMHPLACSLGSDAPYMLKGGFAVMEGRGEKVESVNVDKKLYFIVITCDKIISARKCYQIFDEKKKMQKSTTDSAVKEMVKGDLKSALKHFKNDLQESAIELVDEIKFNLFNLKKAGAEVAMVAGSGPSVLGIFEEITKRDNAFVALKGLYGKEILKAETIIKKEDKYI